MKKGKKIAKRTKDKRKSSSITSSWGKGMTKKVKEFYKNRKNLNEI